MDLSKREQAKYKKYIKNMSNKKANEIADKADAEVDKETSDLYK